MDRSIQRVKISIKTKLISLISFVLLSTIGIITYNAFHLFKNDNLNTVYTSTDTITSSKAREINSTIKAIVKKSTTIATSVTKNGKLGLRKLFLDDPNIVAITLLNKVELGQFKKTKRFVHPKNILTMDHSSDRIIKTLSSEVIPYHVISLGEITASITKSKITLPLMTLGIPLYDKNTGQINNITAVHVKLDPFIKLFKKQESGIYTLYLVNPNGDLVAHPDEKLTLSAVNLSNLGIVQKMKASTLQREFTEFTHPNNGQKYYGAYANIETGNLAVIADVRKDVAFESGQKLIYRSTLVTIMIFFAAFMLSYAMSKKLTSPLIHLTDATTEISQGNLDVSIDIKGNDEIGALASSFNEMVIQLDERQQAIERRIKTLENINTSTKTISATMEVSELLRFYLKSLSELLKVNSLGVWIIEDSKIKYSSQLNYSDNVDILKAFQVIVRNKTAITSDDPNGNVIRLLVPLVAKDDILGFLYVRDKTDHSYFSNEDISLAETISTSLTITLKNIELILETAEKARMEKELETAKLVQDTLFPPPDITFKNFEISSFYTPASECGGDWWGCFYTDRNTIAILMADATGHGVPAALITATAKSSCSTIEYLLHNRPGAISFTPASMLDIINNSVYDSAKGKILMTFFVALLDLETGKLVYSNAGHTNPLVYRRDSKPDPNEKGSKKSIEPLTGGKGLRVGQTLDTSYKNDVTVLNNFDSIVLYTDGITEGENKSQAQYGNGKFQRSVTKHVNKNLIEFKDSLMGDFFSFADDTPLVDDLTLLVGRYERK
jgi:serine phosphatase RsbU (regulator of sigma subunit)/HAMP domain-containing protein